MTWVPPCSLSSSGPSWSCSGGAPVSVHIPVVCRAGYVVVDVPVNRSDKLQQFTSSCRSSTQVEEVLQKIDKPSVEQVIAVPTISLDRIPQRSACRPPQKAEKLVEVPTIVSFSSQQQPTAEQIVDVPVRGRGGGGGRGGVQGSRSRQNFNSSGRGADR